MSESRELKALKALIEVSKLENPELRFLHVSFDDLWNDLEAAARMIGNGRANEILGVTLTDIDE